MDEDKSLIAAQLHATLGPSPIHDVGDRGQFLTYIASSAEIPKDSLIQS